MTLYTSTPNHAKLFDKEKQNTNEKKKTKILIGENPKEKERTSNSDVLLRVTRLLRVLFFPARQVVAVSSVCTSVLELVVFARSHFEISISILRSGSGGDAALSVGFSFRLFRMVENKPFVSYCRTFLCE